MNSGFFQKIDWGLVTPVIVLVVLSLAILSSISIVYFKSQLLFLFLSITVFLFFSQLDYRMIKLYNLPIYIAAICVLLFVLVLGIESRGAVRWLDLFGFRIQFSEILKPFLAISLASFLAQRELSLKTFFGTMILLFPILFLIYLQPDLGNAVIYLVAVIITLIAFGFPFVWFFLGSIISLSTIPVVWHLLRDYQKQRILTFLHPTKDPLGTSYNAVQSIIAVGSGQFFGKGLSEGTQSSLQFLPEHHTDFIFATLSEELGFFGAIVLLIAFAFLLYRIFLIFSDANDPFCKIFAACSFALILIQFFMNVGMNIGLLPIVGITLPFVSYGGSSLLSNFILLGLLSSMASGTSTRRVLEIR